MKLNIFTNCSKISPRIDIIKITYLSFVKIFGLLPLTIYIDPNPNVNRYEEYKKNLKEYFRCDIIETNGLADGYIKSIKEGDDRFIFQLEHDWMFRGINHTLKKIVKLMEDKGVYHFRFNKSMYTKENYKSKWCSVAEEKEYNGIPYIETDNMSNNPHIIDRLLYIEKVLPLIKVKNKSYGIEEELKGKGLVSCVYGKFNDRPTILHLNAKKLLVYKQVLKSI